MIDNPYIDDIYLTNKYADNKYNHLIDFIDSISNNLYSIKNSFDIEKTIEAIKILNVLLEKYESSKIDLKFIHPGTDQTHINNVLMKKKASIRQEQINKAKENIKDYSYLFGAEEEKKISEDEYNYINELLLEIKKVINTLNINDEWKRRITDALNSLISELDRDISKFAERKGKLIEIADMIGQFNNKAITPITNNLTKLMREFRKFTNRKNGVVDTSNQIGMKDDIETIEVFEKNQLEK